MKYFIDSADGIPWVFDDDVVVNAGEAVGQRGSAVVPATLSPCTQAEAEAAALNSQPAKT